MDPQQLPYLGLWMAVGVVIGTTFGYILFPDNVAFGIPMGLALGLVLGAIQLQLNDNDDQQ